VLSTKVLNLLNLAYDPRMQRWEKLSVDLRYHFANMTMVRINSDQPLANMVEEIRFHIQKGVF